MASPSHISQRAEKQAFSAPQIRMNMFRMWEVPSGKAANCSPLSSSGSSACSRETIIHCYYCYYCSEEEEEKANTTTAISFETKAISPPNRSSLLTQGLKPGTSSEAQPLSLSQHLEAARPPTPPRAPARHFVRSSQAAAQQPTKKVRFVTPEPEHCYSKKSPLPTRKRGFTPSDDSTWECCECTTVNSRFEFHCSLCKLHKKCSSCRVAVESEES
ncbi:hypothetical protein OQA88_4754 [Cercophora sp. LCS_1]